MAVDAPTSEPYRLWINGSEAVGNGDILKVEDPATGQIFAE